MQWLTPEQIRQCKGETFVVDTETTGLFFFQNDLIGVGIHCPAKNISGYMPTCDYAEMPYGKAKSKKVWLGKMDYSRSTRGRRVMETITTQPTRNTAIPDEDLIQEAKDAVRYAADDPKSVVIGHNLKFDAHFLDLLLSELPCKIVDTSVMVHLLDSRLEKSLSAAEKEFLGTDSKREHVELAKGETDSKPWLWELDHLAYYCTNDCVVTYRLAGVLGPKLREAKLTKLFSLQMRYLRLLQKIERRGLLTDWDFIQRGLRVLGSNLDNLEKDLYAACGYTFNWRSNAQLSEAIYDRLGIPKPENPFLNSQGEDTSRMKHVNKYNKYRTSSFLLMEKGGHPLGGLILEMRECDKLIKYLEQYKSLSDDDHAVHTSFNLTGTRTGRLSSGKPNLQNIPSAYRTRETQGVYSGGGLRQEEYNLRQAIIARPGYSLVSIDHRQQEMRMFGILAQEPVMLNALRNREDIHLSIAISIWGDCGEERNKIHREWSKTIGFGLIYGMTIGSLQYRLNITPEESQEIAQQYFDKFPRIQPWLNEVIRKCTTQGYVRYWSGRIWREDDPIHTYKGANAQIQGGAADFMSIVLLRADQVLTAQDWGNIVSIVHDEAIFEIKDEHVETASKVLSRVMEGEDIFGLPFATDVKIGKSYGSLKEIDLEVNLTDIVWQDYLTVQPQQSQQSQQHTPVQLPVEMAYDPVTSGVS